MPAQRKGNRGYLARSVDPAIGAASPQDGPQGACQAFEGAFQLALDRSAAGLELPAEKIGTVVVHGEAESTFGMWGHADKVETGEERSRKAWTWSYLLRYPNRPLAHAIRELSQG